MLGIIIIFVSGLQMNSVPLDANIIMPPSVPTTHTTRAHLNEKQNKTNNNNNKNNPQHYNPIHQGVLFRLILKIN